VETLVDERGYLGSERRADGRAPTCTVVSPPQALDGHLVEEGAERGTVPLLAPICQHSLAATSVDTLDSPICGASSST
jgi:hypothetical protein